MSTHSNQIIDDNNYTPEALAWKLLMDDDITTSNLMIFSDEKNKEIVFEILLTIYLEMIFGHYKMQYLEANCNNIDNIDNIDDNDEDDNYDDIYDNFKLDINKVNLFTLTNVFASKFNKLNFILNVREINREEYFQSKQNRYCTVLLKDSPSDEMYFTLNQKHLDPEKRYHFVLNNIYNTKENIDVRDIHCSVNINNVYYKIYFTQITI
jgi:hypothetical protein